MGDRNNPIKFGPEWLRKMASKRTSGTSGNPEQNASTSPGASGSTGPPGAAGTPNVAGNSGNAGSSGSPGPTGASGPSGSSGGATANTSTSSNASANTPNKRNAMILLAKLRYGREEMLALYDRNAQAPQELRYNDTLYQQRGKQPVALNNTFEDDVRENLRTAPPIGGMIPGDRFTIGRGSGRGGGIVSEGRGRVRGSYIRQLSAGRGANWHVGSPRMPTYSGGADDDSGPSRPWANNNSNNSNRNSGDQTDWATKVFRNKRQGNNTNWRQPQSRDEGEEWRASEPGRSRQHEKWDREWAERSGGDRPQNWNNRRPWVGGDNQNNEENLPEWAGENAECGGTFDSSGAFHGYSNDDTNLPKHQDSSYPLTRSHTHGSFSRPKALEEGSEEWWASEKAKKLSPKRFDASDLKFKKQPGIGIADVATSTNHKSNTSKEESSQQAQETVEAQAAGPEPPEANATAQGEDKSGKPSAYKSNKFESKTFDALMRSDINLGEASDERSNFQSVIINSNNSLRQKHQHLVPALNETSLKQLEQFKNNKGEMDHPPHLSAEEIIVDNLFGMALDDKDMLSTSSTNSLMTLSSSGMSAGLPPVENSMPQNLNLQMSMSNSALAEQGMNMELHMNQQGVQTSVTQPLHQAGLQPGLRGGLPGLQMPGMPGGMQAPNLPSGLSNPGYPLQNPRLPLQSMPSGMQGPRGQTPGMQPVLQNVGITNSALNASLGLPIGPNIGMPIQGMPQQILPNDIMAGSPMGGSGMGVMGSGSIQGSSNLPRYPAGNAMPGMPNIFGQGSSSPVNDLPMPMPKHSGHKNMFHLHGMPHSGSQDPFVNSIFNDNALAEQWYYEDPEGNIQGPFPSKDMYNWYRAGFFNPSLMVRRACETMMRPLGSYGPTVPFAHMNMMSPFPMSGGFERPQGAHQNMLSSQNPLRLDVMNLGNMSLSDNPPMDSLQYGSVGLTANQSFGQPQPMDALWGQPSSTSDVWMQQPLSRPEVNNLPIYFWEQQPSVINSNSLLTEDITKEMKTEDQILAQLRASQGMAPPPQPFMPDLPGPSQTSLPEDCFSTQVNATPNMEELHKLIQKEMLTGPVSVAEIEAEIQSKAEKAAKLEQSSSESSVTKASSQPKAEAKLTKQAKETEKSAKAKDATKTKTKKSKDEKKEEFAEIKIKEDDVFKAEKRSQEPSPSKNKKEDKSNKKDLEKEKKEWIKEGFTIVKGSEKSSSKDNKKKAEEARVAEEAERKRKEEEKITADEDKKKKQAETVKKQQEQQILQQQQQQRQVSESVVKKAPWSAVSSQGMQATSRDGLTLAEIQRLEREKKLEQMKEQQQMMQIIAQQQAAALAREQEMQAGLGWAKKKGNNQALPTLTEIQAETRKQAVAAAVAAVKMIEEAEMASAQANHAPWANTHNGGSFWDTPPNQSSKDNKPQDLQKLEVKNKKKPSLVTTTKKESSPAVEFEIWCTGVLASWSSKIDVPTFVGFLKDIESPYEIKDYVKCYLGESKESNDFARQFLERRSKLLRVGMVTPSDDLCSPAIAVNPRTTSGSDYQEVKGKGKKTKKNKMLKVDARILGFSVTAAEDRINVGDIDTV
ncbi:unnamed protein product [Chrysodeixis includens]|uniref:GYF domain-containing protein n=1 Tax=Chrysodeixis includens TaxID=689277 RepID=A0A9P0BGR1_CHRIL|nr:unnamed protein product [Chrysodeixis includens]